MITLETRLDHIAAFVDQHRDDYAAFAHYVDIMWEREQRSDAALDALIDRIAAEVVPHIDCIACANCCRSLPVGITAPDLIPLAKALDTTPEKVTAQYVNRTAGAPYAEWGVLQGPPCPLLDGNRCTVYAQRPAACRIYPAFTPDFRWLIDDILRGVDQCPIIFNVIERLKVELGW